MAWARAHRKLSIAGAALLLAIVIYPFAVGALVAGIVAKRATARLGRAVSVERGRAGVVRRVRFFAGFGAVSAAAVCTATAPRRANSASWPPSPGSSGNSVWANAGTTTTSPP